jgi:hypothetical protein
MKKNEILYDPLPIGRIGVEKETEKMFIATDYSCFAIMLEEYICFGVVNIVIPGSSPEIKALQQIPVLLKKRIKIVDDTKEIETVSRLLYGIRNEFNTKIDESTNILSFPKNTSKELMYNLKKIHSDVKKLSLGFNHNIQINFHLARSVETIRSLRKKIQNSNSRMILAQLEGLLNKYEKVEFDSLILSENNTPIELISIFDKLINDNTYLEYSDSVAQLSLPNKRSNAIVKPDSNAIKSVIQGKAFPQLVNMDLARDKAIEMWKKSKIPNSPLRRDGQPVTDNNILWLPPLNSMKTSSNDNGYLNLGTCGELLEVLKKMQKQTRNSKKNSKRRTINL